MCSNEVRGRIRRAIARPRLVLSASALGVVLVAAACGGGVKYGASNAPAPQADPKPVVAAGPPQAMDTAVAAPVNPASLSAGPAGGAATAPVPGGARVTITNFAFTPATLTVPVGTTVTWTNQDATDHTVTSSTKLFDSGDLQPKGQFSFTFTTAGTYAYFCTIHPFMTATVIVK